MMPDAGVRCPHEFAIRFRGRVLGEPLQRVGDSPAECRVGAGVRRRGHSGGWQQGEVVDEQHPGVRRATPYLPADGDERVRHLDEREPADRVEAAIAAVIAEGRSVTYDMKPTRDDPTAVGTSEVADAIIDGMGVRV